MHSDEVDVRPAVAFADEHVDHAVRIGPVLQLTQLARHGAGDQRSTAGIEYGRPQPMDLCERSGEGRIHAGQDHLPPATNGTPHRAVGHAGSQRLMPGYQAVLGIRDAGNSLH